jgi:hypothetical protein
LASLESFQLFVVKAIFNEGQEISFSLLLKKNTNIVSSKRYKDQKKKKPRYFFVKIF